MLLNWLILQTSFSLNLHFPIGRLFCGALVFWFFFSGYEMHILVGGMCSMCCHMALVLALVLCIAFLIGDCFCPIFFIVF